MAQTGQNWRQRGNGETGYMGTGYMGNRVHSLTTTLIMQNTTMSPAQEWLLVPLYTLLYKTPRVLPMHPSYKSFQYLCIGSNHFELLRGALEKHFTFNIRFKLLVGIKVNNDREFQVVVFFQKEHGGGVQAIEETGGLSLDEVLDRVR